MPKCTIMTTAPKGNMMVWLQNLDRFRFFFGFGCIEYIREHLKHISYMRLDKFIDFTILIKPECKFIFRASLFA